MKQIKLQHNTVNRLAATIHRRNHKWWHDEKGHPIKRDAGELLALVVTEFSEHIEGFRRDLMDDHIPHRKMDEVEIADAVIRILDFAKGYKIKISMRKPINSAFRTDFSTNNRCGQVFGMIRQVVAIGLYYQEENCAGVLIGELLHWIKAYCKIHKLNLERAISEKLEYNRTRKDHTHEARNAPNGKKF